MLGVVPVLSHSDLSLRLRQQELVAAFGRLALRADGLEKLRAGASAAAAEGLKAEFAKVLEYRSRTMDFVVRSGFGWKPGVVGHAVLLGDSHSPAGHAFETGKPVISNHLASEQRFKTPDLLTEHGVESAINVLVGTRGTMTYGVLEVDSTRRGEFNNHDVSFLEALANTLGEALESHWRQDAREALLRDNMALVWEKKLLMQEVHHRVLNSLQLVQSILSMQGRDLGTSEARQHLADEGGGFPDRFDSATSRGLGMRLVMALAKSPSGEALRIDRGVPFARIVVRTGFGGHGGTGTARDTGFRCQ